MLCNCEITLLNRGPTRKISSDIRVLIMNSRAIRLLKQSFEQWSEDNGQRLGASLAFYTILSISPLVILVVAIVSLVFSRAHAQSLLLAQIHALMGSSAREAVQAMLVSGQRHAHGILSAILGLLTLVFGASGVFGELRPALNQIWNVE